MIMTVVPPDVHPSLGQIAFIQGVAEKRYQNELSFSSQYSCTTKTNNIKKEIFTFTEKMTSEVISSEREKKIKVHKYKMEESANKIKYTGYQINLS